MNNISNPILNFAGNTMLQGLNGGIVNSIDGGNFSDGFKAGMLAGASAPIIENSPSILKPLENNLVSSGLNSLINHKQYSLSKSIVLDYAIWTADGGTMALHDGSFNGGAFGGSKYIGPGPNVNPYLLKPSFDPSGECDNAAFFHDKAYYMLNASGASDAFKNRRLRYADLSLAVHASFFNSCSAPDDDQYWGKNIMYLFGTIALNKFR